jgi:hypothetical protein
LLSAQLCQPTKETATQRSTNGQCLKLKHRGAIGWAAHNPVGRQLSLLHSLPLSLEGMQRWGRAGAGSIRNLGAPISLKNKQRRTQAHLLSSGAFPPRPPSHTRHAPPPACAADQLAPLSPAPAHCGIDDQGFPCGVLHTVWYASGGVLSEQSRCTRVCPFR